MSVVRSLIPIPLATLLLNLIVLLQLILNHAAYGGFLQSPGSKIQNGDLDFLSKWTNRVITDGLSSFRKRLRAKHQQVSKKPFDERIISNVNASEVEFCDLAFINDEDKKRAHNEFLNVDPGDNDWDLNFVDSQAQYSNQTTVRHKREITKPIIIETAIFVDSYLNQRFTGRLHDLKRLVMAIMNEVQLIYSYKTMKIPIKIVIVKFEILGGETGPNNAGGDIDKYLDNFCSWQARKLRLQEAQNRWDHALLLSGLDLYKESNGRKNKKVLGLAWVNGMCKPSYSCTLNEGKSFEAAFVIAHELGHSLGILHDGRGNNCDGDKFIMSEKTGPGKVNWSPCSNKYLETFLSRGNGKCLDDSAVPSAELDFERTTRLPDIQCQLALGSQYKAYFSNKEPFNDICRELWCLSGSWATPAHPALEGSTCGKQDRKCYQGSCLIKEDRDSNRRIVAADTPTASGSNVNRRSIVTSTPTYSRYQATSRPSRHRQTPSRQIRIGFGLGYTHPNRRGPTSGVTLGHIPPIFLTTTPAYALIEPVTARIGPRVDPLVTARPGPRIVAHNGQIIVAPSDQQLKEIKESKAATQPQRFAEQKVAPAIKKYDQQRAQRDPSQPKPLSERMSSYLRAMLPEATKFFNFFTFGS